MNSTHEEYEKLGYILEMVGCFDEVNNYDYDDYAVIGELIHKLYYQLEKVFEGDGNGGMRYQYHTDMYNDTEDNSGELSVMGIADTLENAYKLAGSHGYVAIPYTNKWELERIEACGRVFDRVTIEKDLIYTGGEDDE